VKVIFLDVDGVLNSLEHFRDTSGKRKCEADQIDRACVARLNSLTQRTGASIVVSSCWRIGKSLRQLRELFKTVGIQARVVGKTPHTNKISRPRGDEIQSWIDSRKYAPDSFVILDDDSDMAHLKCRLVQTSFEHGGLLDEHIERAVVMLQELHS